MKTALAFLAISGLAQPCYAQQMLEVPRPLPGNVTLSLDEYNRLLALANRPGKKPDTPPVPYVLKHADLKFRIVNAGVIGSIQFDGETLESHAANVPLVSGM